MEAVARIASLPHWRLAHQDSINVIRRDIPTPDFLSALELAQRIGVIAEELGHHPQLTIGWGCVTVTNWTHTIRGLSEADFQLAARIDLLLA